MITTSHIVGLMFEDPETKGFISSQVSWNLVDALENDPFYLTITRDFSNDLDLRRNVLRSYFEYSIRESQEIGRCIVFPDDSRGAAIWIGPVSPSLLSKYGSDKHRFLESILGEKGLADYHRIMDFMTPRAEEAVGKDAWYLSILGVSPSAQGKGLGRRLLEPFLHEKDNENAECYLETYSPRTIRFYERLGFECVASYLEPVTSSEYWIMVRRSDSASK